MNLGAQLTDLYARLRYPSPPAAITTRLKSFLNEAHRELLSLPGMERLRDDTLAITANANQVRTGLPPAVGRIHGITDHANNRKLEQVPISELRNLDPGQTFNSGYAFQYAVVGYRQIQVQPSAATGIWAVSSVAGDTAQKVFLEGLTTGGYHHIPASAGTTLTGMSRVQLGARTDLIQLDKFYLDTTTTGYVSLFDAVTAGNELARIEPGVLYSRYLTVEWYPVQTADVIEYVDYSRNIFDMVNSTDEPLLPPDFHYLLGLGARIKEYELLDDGRGGQARADYERGKAALRSWVLNDGDRIASMRPVPRRRNRLGANYPAQGGS